MTCVSNRILFFGIYQKSKEENGNQKNSLSVPSQLLIETACFECCINIPCMIDTSYMQHLRRTNPLFLYKYICKRDDTCMSQHPYTVY